MRRFVAGFSAAAAVSLGVQSQMPMPEQPPFSCEPAVEAEGMPDLTQGVNPAIEHLGKVIGICFDRAPAANVRHEKPNNEMVVIPSGDGGAVRFSRQLDQDPALSGGKVVKFSLDVLPNGESDGSFSSSASNTIDFDRRQDGQWQACWTVAHPAGWQRSQWGCVQPPELPFPFRRNDVLSLGEHFTGPQEYVFVVGQLALQFNQTMQDTTAGGPLPSLAPPVPLR